MYDIETLRQTEFPSSSEFTYLNHASISPLPTRSRKMVQWVLEGISRQPVAFWIEEGMPMYEAFQQEIMGLINAASVAEIVAVTNTGTGLNYLAQAIAWQPGDNLLLCDMEFPANVYPWMSLARDGVEVRSVPAVDGGLTLEALRPLVDEHTRLVTASAVQFFSGHRTDLAAIGAFCQERDILFVVDAIQAIGHMKIDVQAMYIDALVTGGQKSLLSLPGTGFMYVRNEVAETLTPRVIGGNATQDFMHWLAYDLTFLPGAARFNSGTPNLPGMAATLESVRLLQLLGVAHIDRHTSYLVDVAIEQLTAAGYEMVTPRTSHGPIATFRSGYNNEETDALVSYLHEHKTAVVKHLDGPGTPHIRLSFHAYNTVAEIERCVALLQAFEPNG